MDVFRSITGASEEVAKRYLAATGNNVEQAVSNYFDNPPAKEEEAPPSNSSRIALRPPAVAAPPPMPVPVVGPPPPPPPVVFDVSAKNDAKKKAVLKSSSIMASLCDFNLDVTFKASFENPFDTPIEAVFRYRGDGIVCYGYEVEIGGTRIRSVAQEKTSARDTYDDAISMGGAAFLAEHKDDTTFQVSLGAFPPKSECTITFSFLQEASLDEETAQTIVELPMASVVPQGGMSCELNVQGSDVQAIESLSQHPIRIEKTATGMRAILEKTELQRQVRLAVKYNDPGLPWPKVETDGGSTAVQIMFVPRVELDDAKGEEVVTEVVILVDRSGSMAGGRMRQTKSSLQILLRSLPPGTLFNIVSFGSDHQNLFPSSVALTEATFKRASEAVGEFDARMGGTNILGPLSAILASAPQAGFPRQVIVMTDGEVDNTDAVIAQVRDATARTPTRVFALGIGMDASPALIRGVAKAGHGAAEFVHGEMRIEPVVARIIQRVLRPVIESVRVDWGDLKAVHVTPGDIPTVFSGQKVTSIALLAANDGQKHKVSLEMKLSGNVTRKYVAEVDLATALPGKSVHRLAASSLVSDVVSKKVGGALTAADATALAVRYGIASKLTSLVAVDEASSGASFSNQIMVQVDGNQGVLDAKPELPVARRAYLGGGAMRAGPGSGNFHPTSDAGKAAPPMGAGGGGYRNVSASAGPAPPSPAAAAPVDDNALDNMLEDLVSLQANSACLDNSIESSSASKKGTSSGSGGLLGMIGGLFKRDETPSPAAPPAQVARPASPLRASAPSPKKLSPTQSPRSASPSSSRKEAGARWDSPDAGTNSRLEERLRGKKSEAAVAEKSMESAPDDAKREEARARLKDRLASRRGQVAQAEVAAQDEEEEGASAPDDAVERREKLKQRLQDVQCSSSSSSSARSRLSARAGDDSSFEVNIKLDAGARPLDRLLVLQGFDGSWQLNEAFAAAIGKSLSTLTCPDPTTDSKAWATCLAIAVLEISFAAEKAEWTLVVKKARKFLSQTHNLDALSNAARTMIGPHCSF